MTHNPYSLNKSALALAGVGIFMFFVVAIIALLNLIMPLYFPDDISYLEQISTLPDMILDLGTTLMILFGGVFLILTIDNVSGIVYYCRNFDKWWEEILTPKLLPDIIIQSALILVVLICSALIMGFLLVTSAIAGSPVLPEISPLSTLATLLCYLTLIEVVSFFGVVVLVPLIHKISGILNGRKASNQVTK